MMTDDVLTMVYMVLYLVGLLYYMVMFYVSTQSDVPLGMGVGIIPW